MVVEECEFSKALHGLELLPDDIIDYDFHGASFDNEETRADAIFVEKDCSFFESAVEHILFYIIELILAEIVEDEVVFETGNDETGVVVGLDFVDGPDVLGYPVGENFKFFLNLSGLLGYLMHRFQYYIIIYNIIL